MARQIKYILFLFNDSTAYSKLKGCVNKIYDEHFTNTSPTGNGDDKSSFQSASSRKWDSVEMINERPINFNLHFSISSSPSQDPFGLDEKTLNLCWKLSEISVQTISPKWTARKGQSSESSQMNLIYSITFSYLPIYRSFLRTLRTPRTAQWDSMSGETKADCVRRWKKSGPESSDADRRQI